MNVVLHSGQVRVVIPIHGDSAALHHDRTFHRRHADRDGHRFGANSVKGFLVAVFPWWSGLNFPWGLALSWQLGGNGWGQFWRVRGGGMADLLGSVGEISEDVSATL